MMSLRPDAIEVVGIFENNVLSTLECDGRCGFDQRRLCGHRERGVLRLDGQADFEAHGHSAPDRKVSMVMLEADSIDFEVVDVRGNICELKLAGGRGHGFPPIQGQIVGQAHACVDDSGTARISDLPADGPGTSKRLAETHKTQG